MAKVIAHGIDETGEMISRLANAPDKVIEDMLVAGASIVADAQKKRAVTDLAGPYNKKEVANAVYIKKTTTDKHGNKCKYIIFRGERKQKSGNQRYAAIAFVNEYGAPDRGIPARPFIRHAIEESANEAFRAMERVYDDFLDSI